MTTITRYPPTATTPQARNRSTNPAMTTGALTNWSLSTGAGSMAYSSVAGSSLRFMTSAAGVAVVEQIVPASPGEVFSLSVDIQPFTSARTGLLRVYFLNAASTDIAGPFSSTAAAPLAGWTTVTLNNVTAPANTAYIRVLVGITDSAGAGQAINVTRLMISNGTVVSTYFDGNTPSSYPLFYYWEGQRGLSASRRVDVLGGPDQIHPTAVAIPFDVTRESRSVVRPLAESSTVRAVLIAAGPRTGSFEFYTSPSIAMTWLNFFSTASLYYLQDESWATMWFGLGGGDVRFSQEWGNSATLEVPFIETSAPT